MVPDLGRLATPAESAGHGIAGRFHAAPILKTLRVAARTGRHVLLEGETGVGKELAARALHEVLAEIGRTGPLRAENAALFAGDDDAVATLFGVGRGGFTGVEPRQGAIELADRGTLFLDEVHNLPSRAQKSLLRFVEDGLLHRLGQTAATSTHLDVRLVAGTNLDVERALDEGRLAHDLVSRLHRVTLPPLRERRADVPSILEHLIRGFVAPPVAEAVLGSLDAETVERLCRHDYRRGNVRELEELVALMNAHLAEGAKPELALERALRAVLRPLPDEEEETAIARLAQRSAYERHREQILSTYREVGGNITRLQERLRQRGIPSSRRWLGVFLERWGVRPRGGKK
jgi:arginine utilization regulatory protein